jgi:two-component system sensor histidine kinase RegB
MSVEFPSHTQLESGHNLRLETLINIRWLAIIGQSAAVSIVWLVLGFQFNTEFCAALIVTSAFLNLILSVRYPASTRLSERASSLLLAYDIVQLASLLFLTGGLGNPFSILLLVPVFISATTLSVRSTIVLGILSLSLTSLLAFFYFPLPWNTVEGLRLPLIYIMGMWFAIVSSLLFTTLYAFRVSQEARQLSNALAATELVLQREQHLSNIDGLAAAAAHELGTPLATISLVAKEMQREVEKGTPAYEDVALLTSQAERCREIMRTLTSLSSEGDEHIAVAPFSAILEEVSQPHRNFGVDIDIAFPRDGNEPECIRNPAMLYGLGNLVENAVDYARNRVVLAAGWDAKKVWVEISDDGHGFDEETIDRIGEPYLNSGSKNKPGGGLGLGLFIAKTLLERNGATIDFSNAGAGEMRGARVLVRWPRTAIEA